MIRMNETNFFSENAEAEIIIKVMDYQRYRQKSSYIYKLILQSMTINIKRPIDFYGIKQSIYVLLKFMF